MDRRRLEKAHLQYAILVVAEWYSPDVLLKSINIIPGRIDDLISTFATLYHSLFLNKYAGKLDYRWLDFCPWQAPNLLCGC